MGLTQCSSMPDCTERSMSSDRENPVKAMSSAWGSIVRRSRASACPPRSGIAMSRITMSGACERASSSACCSA